MANFVGMTVEVTLRHPPDTVLRGEVEEVLAGQTLTLRNVVFPHTGARWDQWTVQSTAITDVQVVNTTVAEAPPSSQARAAASAPPLPDNAKRRQQSLYSSHPAQSSQATPSPQQPDADSLSFVDPAILSYGRSPAHTSAVRTPSDTPATPVKTMLAKAAESLPANRSPFVGDADRPNGLARMNGGATSAQKPTQYLQEQRPPTLSNLQDGNDDEILDPGLEEKVPRKKVRRGQKKKGLATDTIGTVPAVMNSDVSRNGNDMNGTVKREKGWRQTPLLQPSPQATGLPDSSAIKRPSRRQRGREQDIQQNGWATEDASDIQGMEDFDFEANHKLFDKKQVFDLLRQGDTTADEDRLVSHNKIHRPGTYGGKNLHPTENVLSPKLGPTTHTADKQTSSDTDTELNIATGRSSSRQSAMPPSAAKKQPSRQNSTLTDSKPHPLTASMSSDRGLSRSVTSLASRGRKQVPSLATSSPKPSRVRSPRSAISTNNQAAHPPLPSLQQPHFMIVKTLKKCPVLHPSALDTLEAETTSRYGLTQDAITEAAARCVAEVAISMFAASGESRRGSRAQTTRATLPSSTSSDRSSKPVVVILAGNNVLGARALAAARHLVPRNNKIIVSEVVSTEQEPQIKSQTTMLRRMMRGGAEIKRGLWQKASGYIKSLTGPPSVIIDALLPGETYGSLQEPAAQCPAEVQKDVRDMIDWANRSRAPVLSLGCPSGVSGIDGTTTLLEGEPLAIRPDKILCLGVPVLGLVEGMKAGEKWEIGVADIGINIALRSEEAVSFGGQWVAEVNYVDHENEEVDELR